MTVVVQDGNVERSLRTLKRKLGNEGMRWGMKRHAPFLRPGERRSQKPQKAV
jgi:ribosomal protein S21